MANSQTRLHWKGINLIVHFDFSEQGVDDIENIIPADDKWEESASDILHSLKDEAVEEIELKILSGYKSKNERSFQSIFGTDMGLVI